MTFLAVYGDMKKLVNLAKQAGMEILLFKKKISLFICIIQINLPKMDSIYVKGQLSS